MASLDKAKYDLTNLYAINSLFWSKSRLAISFDSKTPNCGIGNLTNSCLTVYLRSFGDDPKNTSIKEELDRIRRQMVRLSQIANKSKMPRLDREVANRFIRHELPVKAGVKGAVQKKLLSNLESENWEEEPMETDEGKKVEGDNVCKVSENVSRKRKHESECQVQEEIISDSDAAEVISSSSESELETSDW